MVFLSFCLLSKYFYFSEESKKQKTSADRRDQGNLSLVEEQWIQQRNEMITSQICEREIKNTSVLKALSRVPRHLFVPEDLAPLAYVDAPLSIGYGQTISQPYIVACMTEMAKISPEDKVLEIGTGCGYQTAVLAELAKTVYTVEIIPQLAKRADKILRALGYTNIQGEIGDGYQGWAEYAPYDAIVVAAAPEQIPQPLIEQMAMNATMIIPVGKEYQTLIRLKKTPQGLIEEKIFPVRFVPFLSALTGHTP